MLNIVLNENPPCNARKTLFRTPACKAGLWLICSRRTGSASSAEILAAALKDSYGADIVGNQTYGKGSVQTVKYYEDTAIKYTSAIWLRPNGESVDGVGITPDYDVSNVIKNNALEDKQFDKALQLFN